jgi:FKBP-type peptidyl-prolyl cis-trans isomerase FklB
MNRTIALLVLGCLVIPVFAADAGMSTVSERYSYAMGVRFGELLKGQGIRQLDSRSFAKAIDDVLGGQPLRLSEADMQAAILGQRQAQAGQRAQRAQANLAAGREFLSANASKAGVVLLPSGLQYRVLDSGSGDQPGPGDSVRVHYHGTLIDGTVFDSSRDRGQAAEFGLAGVIPGFREALSHMRVGDRWQVFMPSTLAYGEQGAGADIGPNETLIFELQLLDVIHQAGPG